MKKIIIVLMVFTAILCYSQVKSSDTQKVASKSAKNVSIEEFKELKETVNKLAENNKKLQDEKNILENKFKELNTEKILEKSQKFYSDSFNYLLVIVIGLGALLYFFQRKDLKDEKENISKSFDIEKKYLLKEVNDENKKLKTIIDNAFKKNTELEKKIDNAVDENKKLKTAIDTAVDDNKGFKKEINDLVEFTNKNFAVNYMQIAKQQQKGYDACLDYFSAVFYANRSKDAENIIKDYNIADNTVARITNFITTQEAITLKDFIQAELIKPHIKPATKEYFEACFKAVEAELKKVKKQPDIPI